VKTRLTLAATAAAATIAVTPGPANPQEPPPADPNPCNGPMKRELLCPDLQMSPPYDLRIDKTRKRGRVLLRAANSLNSRGQGPAELFGTRHGKYTMTATQKIHMSDGSKLTVNTGAIVGFKSVPGQGHYWKFQNAASFQLWKVDSLLRPVKRVRTGPKVYYCLRDLAHTDPKLPRSPRTFVYPRCAQSATKRHVTLGTSVGWSDQYPATYNEQWIDVTGLHGVYAYIQVADPMNGIWESNEDNNSAMTIVRLPSGRTVRSGSAGEPTSQYPR
jgi:hypothetical protein